MQVLKQILDSLRGMEGKPLTWHLEKKLTKYHPSQKFDLDNKTHAWVELTITGEGFDALRLNMGYKGYTDAVNSKVIEENNQAYLLDEQRIPKWEEELKTIEARVKRYNDALVEVNRARENLGTGYFAFTDNPSLSLYTPDGKGYKE